MPVALTSGGLPVGLEIDGPPGSDRDLLAVALAVLRNNSIHSVGFDWSIQCCGMIVA